MNVQKTASLHEDSVQAIARGEVSPYRARRAPSRRECPEGTARNFKVNPAIMERARRLAGGDMSRLRIVGTNEVIIVNNGRQN